MALRRFMIIAPAISLFIVSCAAYDIEASSIAIAKTTSDGTSTKAKAFAESEVSAKSPKRRICKDGQNPMQCPANEVARCVNSCPPEKTCKNRDIVFDCLASDEPCEEKCVCKEGYFRNYLGTCITKAQCEQCSKKNEFFACDSACDNECSKLPDQDRKNCPIVNIVCNSKCYCEDGFARDNCGNCIPVEKCPPKQQQCPANEEVRCVTSCPPEKSCKNSDIIFKCKTTHEPCVNKCVCKEGYYRNSLGTCITKAQCKQCSKKNEFFACDSACDNECSKWPKQNRTNCPIKNKTCNPKCYCEDGFARDNDGNCIPVDKCQKDKPICGDNEILDDCPANCASDHCPKCEEDNKKCPKPAGCPPPACKCGFNYRRAANGTCIPTEKCPPFDCSAKPNEQWDPCPPLCPTDSCGLPRVTGKCPFRIGTRLECNPKCQCKKGYGRTKDGICVPLDKCPPLCPNPHEVYENSRIPNCPLLGTCNSILARIACDKPEVPGCICEGGYLRKENQTSPCIPQCECKEMASTSECQKKNT